MSIWAALDDPLADCSACGIVMRKLPVGIVATGAYGILLVLRAFSRLHGLLTYGLLVAFGAHVFLVSNLFYHGLWCFRCGMTAATCGLCVLAVCARQRFVLAHVAATCLTVAILQFVTSIVLPTPESAKVLSLVNPEDFSKTAVTLIVLAHEDSVGEREIGTRVRPVIDQEFGKRVRWISRRAVIPDVVDPTVVIGMRKDHARVIVGVPEFSLVRGHVLQILEEENE